MQHILVCDITHTQLVLRKFHESEMRYDIFHSAYLLTEQPTEQTVLELQTICQKYNLKTAS